MKELVDKLEILQKKVKVRISLADGSFDRKDKNRVSKRSRLRKGREEIKKEQEGDMNQRLQDWYDDIEKGTS